MTLEFLGLVSLLLLYNFVTSLQKLKRRTEAMDKIDWGRREKGKVAEVLTEEYMSSEVSESGEESLSGDEGCSKEKKLYIKTVPWESEEL